MAQTCKNMAQIVDRNRQHSRKEWFFLAVFAAQLYSCTGERWVLWGHNVAHEEWKPGVIATDEWKEIVTVNSLEDCENKKQEVWKLMTGREAIGPIISRTPYESITFRVDEVKGTSPVVASTSFLCLKKGQNPKA